MRPSAVPPIQSSRRKVPMPVGPLTGKRTPWRRFVSRCTATVNRVLDFLPGSKWLHQRLQGQLEFAEVAVPMGPKGRALHGLRIAFVSDLHAGSFMNERDLVRVFAAVAEQEPDLVCLGGDLINTREREILMFRRPLQMLRPRLGVFAVPGNHDHFWGRDIGLWQAFLQDQGVNVLLNVGQRVSHNGGSLWVCGVDDLTEGQPDLARALEGRQPQEPTLLLSHHPDFFFEAAAVDVHLTLSGHTHGGQVRMFGWSPIRHSRFGYEQGLFEEEDCRLYVGRGVGVTFLPIRIGARPEVPLIRFVAPE